MNLFFCFSASAQYADLQDLPSKETIAKKLQIRAGIQQHLDTINSPLARWQQCQEYYELAKIKADSFFLAHSLGQLALMTAILSDTLKYEIQGAVIRSRSIQENLYLPESSNYIYRYTQALSNEYLNAYSAIQNEIGVKLQEIPQKGTLELYAALSVFKDEEGRKTFSEVVDNNDWFKANQTMYHYDTSAVYWAKLNLYGHESGSDSCVFLLENRAGFQSWDTIEAYLVHENGTIEHSISGMAIPKSKKYFDRYNNLLIAHLAAQENATLYLRLSATTGRRHPTYIGLRATKKGFLSDNDTYQASGLFPYSSGFTPFRGAKMEVQNMYIDRSNEKDAAQIIANWEQLPLQYAYDVAVKPEEAYWVKIRLLGSDQFTAKHLFHVSPYPFVGTDVFAFDRYDAYVVKDGQIQSHQQTGGTVAVSQRAYPFWANFIAVDLLPKDTLDLYIRMSGGHEQYDLSRFDFWHIDPDSVFPIQLDNAAYNYFYFGALVLQCLFFLILFFIERDHIHLYFAILILGIFLGTAFVDDNYRNFVLFPAFRPWHIPLFFTGMYLVQFGFIKFSEAYFSYDVRSVWSKYIIPVFLLVSAGITINGIVKFDYLVPPYYPVTEGYHIAAILALMLGLVFSFLLGLRNKSDKKALRRFFIIAFLPGLLMGLFLLLRSILGGFSSTIHLIELFPTVLSNYHTLRFSILAMLLLLALSMGYRTNLLKADRQKALQENVTAQQVLIEQLQQTNHLQELVRLKTRFYNNITHEFRTPLTVILGMTEQGNHPKAMSLIRRNGQKLLQLINHLLDLSKLDSGLLQATYKQVEIVHYSLYIGESFQSLAEKKYIQLTIYSEIDQLWMDIDEERYRQIISNLLSNAIKFTPERGKVILHLSKQKDQLCIKIKDTGIGISKEELPHIFDRFYQVDDARNINEAGTGIGLALVKELVHLLEGDIKVQSQLNKETTFELCFPIRLKATQKLLIQESSVSLESDQPTIVPTTADDKVLPRLLLIEDNADVVTYIQSLLEEDYHLLLAANGEEGIQLAIAEIPDIIISDVMMPKKNGFEVLENLKQDERTSHIPIIMLTAKATQEDRLLGLKYGADAYLMKPFDKKELFIRLEKLLEIRQQLRVRYAQAAQPILTYVSPPDAAPAMESSIDDLFLRKLRQIIDEKIGDADLDIAYLCEAIGMSSTQLFRKMKALSGEAPLSFIRKVRLHKAKELLLNTEKSIAEIAYELGFTDPNYFSRAFKKEFGRSPSALRK